MDQRAVTQRRRIKRRALAPSETLNWQTVHIVEINCVKIEVNKAMGRQGALYSFRIYRQGQDGRESNYLRGPYDADDGVEAIQQAHQWINTDRRVERDV